MTVQDIMNKWVEVCDYDKNRHTFNLMNYDIHKAGELAEKILAEYDREGKLSLIILKKAFIENIGKSTISLLEIMQDRHVLDKYIELYDILNSSTMTDIENAVKQTVAGMYKNVTGQSLIEDTDKSADFTYNIGEIVTDISKLRQETYKVGHGEIEINRVAKDILVFNTLAEAIVTLEQSNIADGAYVSYINLNESNESYFAIMLKSNGWLASWNDRIDEVYYGQHEVLSTRNNRWASDKKDKLFPYDSLLDYSNHDHKGCATTFKIKDEYINDDKIRAVKISKLNSYSGDVNLIIGLVLWKMKFQGFTLSKKVVYSTSLLGGQSEILSSNKDENNLIHLNAQIVERSEYARENREIDLKLDANSVKNPKSIGLPFKETELVKMYGHDFSVECTSYIKSSEQKEFIGDIERIKESNMYLAREELADKIKADMQLEMTKAGGEINVRMDLVKILKNHVCDILVDIKKHFSNEETVYYGEGYTIRKGDDPYTNYARKYEMLNEQNSKKEYLCPISGAVAKIGFIIKFERYSAIKKFTGDDEIPEVLKLLDLKDCAGNPLLDMVDPVERIRSPFERKYMTCCLNLSKSGLNKIMKI